MEQLQNGAGSATLNGAINNSTTSVVVDSVSGNLPASGTFSVNVFKLTGTTVSQFETMRVLSVASNTLTVATRSSGVAHDDGSTVEYTVDTVSFQRAVDDRIVAAGGVSGEVALTDGVTIASDWTAGATFRVTIAGNRTLSNPSNAAGGMRRLYRVKQDGTGGRTLNVDTKFRIPPAFTTGALGPDLTSGGTPFGSLTAIDGNAAVFDNDPATAGADPSGAATGSNIGYDFGSGNAKSIVGITWQYWTANFNTVDVPFQLQWSDDNSAWTSAGAFTPIHDISTAQLFRFTKTAVPHRYWRAIITAGNGGNIWVNEVQMMEALGTDVLLGTTPGATTYLDVAYDSADDKFDVLSAISL